MLPLVGTNVPIGTTHATSDESAGTRTTTDSGDNQGVNLEPGSAETGFSATNHEAFWSQFTQEDLRLDPHVWMQDSPVATRLEFGPFVEADMETLAD
jgi:hypothetical protein